MARRCFLARKRNIPILLLFLATYFLVRRISPSLLRYKQPSASLSPQRGTTPVYEYDSFYRAHASKPLEDELDKQLLAIEYAVSNGEVLKADRNIWQTASPDLAKQFEAFIEQWRSNNPEWSHNLIYDTAAEKFVQDTFASVPLLVEMFKSFSQEDLRADLLRYLILWYNGGLYMDVDTWGRVGLRDCSPVVDILQGHRDVSLLLGVEIDEPYLTPATKEAWHWSRSYGFSQYAMFAAQRFDPILRTAIVRAISHAKLLEHSRGWTSTFGDTGYVEEDVLEVTGPGMFTDAVLDTLSEGIGGMHGLRDRDAGLDRRVTWKGFHNLKGTVWVQGKDMVAGRGKGRGVGVLPINVWGNGQRHSGSGTFDEEAACINHVFGRVWKKGWWEWAFG